MIIKTLHQFMGCLPMSKTIFVVTLLSSDAYPTIFFTYCFVNVKEQTLVVLFETGKGN